MVQSAQFATEGHDPKVQFWYYADNIHALRMFHKKKKKTFWKALMDGIKNWGKSASQSALHYFGFFECSWIVQTARD